MGLALGALAAASIRRPRLTLQAGAFAIGFCLLALAASLPIPDTYTSSAMLQITTPEVPESLTRPVPAPTPAKTIQRLQDGALSDFSLLGIVTDPALDLYKRERVQARPEEVIAAMRQHIVIQTQNTDPSSFEISFSYPDRYKSRAVVRALVARFTEDQAASEKARVLASGDPKLIEIWEHRLGANLYVLAAPSGPQKPGSPNRWAISLAGFALGGLFGAVTGRTPQRRTPALARP